MTDNIFPPPSFSLSFFLFPSHCPNFLQVPRRYILSGVPPESNLPSMRLLQKSILTYFMSLRSPIPFFRAPVYYAKSASRPSLPFPLYIGCGIMENFEASSRYILALGLGKMSSSPPCIASGTWKNFELSPSTCLGT